MEFDFLGDCCPGKHCRLLVTFRPPKWKSSSNSSLKTRTHHIHLTVRTTFIPVVKTSLTDNGPSMILLNSIREKRQGSIWEQTICVPTVLNWKGHIKDRWLISTPVTVMDVMPSVLELLNVSSAAVHTDGKSLLPVLLNTSQESQHEYIFHYVEVTKPAAVTTGPYKLIYTDTKDDGTAEIFDPPLLFNVETDPEETSPLSNDEYSELLSNVSEAVMRHMQTRRNKWHSQLDSRIIPFWFPCANLHCSQTNDETNNFSDLFDLDHDDT